MSGATHTISPDCGLRMGHRTLCPRPEGVPLAPSAWGPQRSSWAALPGAPQPERVWVHGAQVTLTAGGLKVMQIMRKIGRLIGACKKLYRQVRSWATKPCYRCHFFTMRRVHYEDGKRQELLSVSQDERDMLDRELPNKHSEMLHQKIDVEHAYSCFKGVWTPPRGLPAVMQDREEARLRGEPAGLTDRRRIEMHRGETCFFYPYTPRMSLETAEELQSARARRRQSWRSSLLRMVQKGIGWLLVKVLGG